MGGAWGCARGAAWGRVGVRHAAALERGMRLRWGAAWGSAGAPRGAAQGAARNCARGAAWCRIRGAACDCAGATHAAGLRRSVGLRRGTVQGGEKF